MHANACHLTAVRGDAPVRIKRAQFFEYVACTGQHGGRRCVEPTQSARITRAPASKLQRQRNEVCLYDLGRRERCEASMRAFAPCAIGDTGLRATCPTLPLVRGGARDALRLEPTHARGGIEYRATDESGVDHDAYALDGQTRLGDVGSEHDFACAPWRRRKGGVLILGSQLAEEGEDTDGAGGLCRFQERLHATNLAGAG